MFFFRKLRIFFNRNIFLANGTCTKDLDCVASLDSCVDFDKCVNMNNFLDIKSDATCDALGACTDCDQGVDCGLDENTNGAGIKIGCDDSQDHYPANNGGING